MESLGKADLEGLIVRLNAGYRFRFSGNDAQNDGIQLDSDLGFLSDQYAEGRLSHEYGFTLDPFGETLHFGGYLQLNLHVNDLWTVSLRGLGAGSSDQKETVNGTTQADGTLLTEDDDDLGGLFEGDVLVDYQVKDQLAVGLRVGYNLQAYGDSGTDQGTQHSLSTLMNIVYQF